MRPRQLQEQADLSALNTMATAARGRYLVAAATADEAREALDWASSEQLPVLVLGGGSNLLFRDDFPGLVLRMALRGRHWRDVSGSAATLVLAAGENWHEAVLYAATAGYRGLENLALIPGTAGAAPVQNIGAYGVELSDTMVELAALDRDTGERVTLSAAECRFGYRTSVFREQPQRYLILEVHLRLSRDRPLKLDYGELATQFAGHRKPPTPLAVARTVMGIRRQKLPDPAQLPNAGSFFKNPLVNPADWERLKTAYPDIVAFPAGDRVKLAAAWLIDQCGWKGYRNSRVGVHNHQALVLINHSGGSGRDVLDLAQRIRADVLARFGVSLDMEPGLVPPLQ